MRTWTELTSHGAEVIGNGWLLDQGVLCPGQFIDELKLWTNTHGTKVAIRQGSPSCVLSMLG